MADKAYTNGKKLLWGDYFEYTPTGASLARKQGKYTTNGAEVKRGDIVFYYSASLGRIGHVGAVIVLDNDKTNKRLKVTTVEGNTSSELYERNGGCVGTHVYEISYSQIGGTNRFNGFAHPNYGEDTCTAEEFIQTAKDEIGYIEKATNANLDVKSSPNNGSNNYTKYGKWYGDNGQLWCAQFISWCAYKACEKHLEAHKDGFETQGNGTIKYKRNGEYVRSEWLQIDGEWYVFCDDGTMATGWFGSYDDGWFFMDEKGRMMSSCWVKHKGEWYYLTESGLMATNAYVKCGATYCYVNETGEYRAEWDTQDSEHLVYEVVK